MKKIYWLTLLLFAVSCDKNSLITLTNETDLIPKSGGEIVLHTYFTLSYSEPNEQAEWVFFKLTTELVNGSQERTDDYREDSSVSTGSATLGDYKYSGYDRGHLCPAGSMTLNFTSMSESFYLSNMSPQTAGFNRGAWSRLEAQVRDWVNTYGKVWEVTGPVFKNNLDTIGANQVTVPGSYYKIIFRDNDKMIGFLLKHESSSKNLSAFAVKVDSIETLTGIDFFPGLDNELESRLENKVELANWEF
jgi:endonuclease G